MGTGKDKRYFDREFKYDAIRLMNKSKTCLWGRWFTNKLEILR